jgi:hypothetical protein
MRAQGGCSLVPRSTTPTRAEGSPNKPSRAIRFKIDWIYDTLSHVSPDGVSLHE